MNDYIISCSSTADLSKEHFERIGVPYVCFHFTIDGKTYPDDLGESIPFKQFYDRMAAGSMTSTSQVNIDEFVQFFSGLLDTGRDLIHIELSSGLSGSYNSACAAAEMLREKYPDQKLYVVDSLGASSGFGLLVNTLAKKRAVRDIVDRMEQHAENGLDYSGRCYICNSDFQADAEEVARLVEERFPKLSGKVEIYSIGTVIGSHTGPGTIALFFWGDERKD
ncbi:MAG: DegV family protein [Clostridia bacterium]|nr:DegV family protein [Clostridia bacterium]